MRRCAGTSLGLRCSRVVVLRRHDPLERQALTGEIDASVAPATNTRDRHGGERVEEHEAEDHHERDRAEHAHHEEMTEPVAQAAAAFEKRSIPAAKKAGTRMVVSREMPQLGPRSRTRGRQRRGVGVTLPLRVS
jgi:hypothetical protein